MPYGKPAGVRCSQLLDNLRCALFGDPRRPAVCGSLSPSVEMCGDGREHALHFLTRLESLTVPVVEALRPPDPVVGQPDPIEETTMKNTLMAFATAVSLLLAGCANVDRGSNGAMPLSIPAASTARFVLNVQGSAKAAASPDWPTLQAQFAQSLSEAVAGRNIAVKTQNSKATPTGEAGTLIVVTVADFRYAPTGSATTDDGRHPFVDTRVRYEELRSGAVYGERSYDTQSSALARVFSETTAKQVDAIAQAIADDAAPR